MEGLIHKASDFLLYYGEVAIQNYKGKISIQDFNRCQEIARFCLEKAHENDVGHNVWKKSVDQLSRYFTKEQASRQSIFKFGGLKIREDAYRARAILNEISDLNRELIKKQINEAKEDRTSIGTSSCHKNQVRV